MTKKYLIFSSLGIIILTLGVMFKNHIINLSPELGIRDEQVEFPDGYTIGSWLWKSPDELTDQQVKELLSFAHEEKINTIFLDIGKYLDII